MSERIHYRVGDRVPLPGMPLEAPRLPTLKVFVLMYDGTSEWFDNVEDWYDTEGVLVIVKHDGTKCRFGPGAWQTAESFSV